MMEQIKVVVMADRHIKKLLPHWNTRCSNCPTWFSTSIEPLTTVCSLIPFPPTTYTNDPAPTITSTYTTGGHKNEQSINACS